MTLATHRRLTLEEYLTYDDGTDTRYELVQGELRAMTPPTWQHLRIARYLELIFNQAAQQLGHPWEAFREPGQQTDQSSARLPDVAIVPSSAVDEALDQSAILTTAALLIVEVVSASTATQDYREKVQEYQSKGIPEYWVVDPDPFGAAKYIGSPKRPTISIYQLVDGSYQVQRFQGSQGLVSPLLPQLQLTVEQVFQAGR